MAADGILGSKGGAAQHDEDQDKVGEDVVVNELVAAHTDPVEKGTAWMQACACWAPPGLGASWRRTRRGLAKG